MKKLVLLSLVMILAACSSVPPTAAPVAPPAEVLPSPTPVVVVQTVVVPATQAPAEVLPTEVPPTAAPVVVTVVVQPTEVPPTAAPVQQPAASDGLISIDDTLGVGYFSNITMTGSQLSLRCQLYKDITFKVKPMVDTISQVELHYRIEDRNTGEIFGWQNRGKMYLETDGTFTLVFNGEEVKADNRRANAWLDFQFIGLSKTGDVVGRSEKIEQKIAYTIECP